MGSLTGRFRFAATAALVLAAGLLVPSAADAAKLKPVGKLSVVGVATGGIEVGWRDRSKGESRYEAKVLGPGDELIETTKAKRNANSAAVGGLDPEILYRVEVRACRKSNCAAARAVSAATLLAPFDGPHPDPGCTVFPASDEFNRDVSAAPLHPRSNQIIAAINAAGGDEFHPDFGSNPEFGIPYVVVPAIQPRVPIRFTAFGDESDPGPYPIPPGSPIEGGPSADGDRHVLVVQQPASPGGSCGLFELYRSFEAGNGWEGDSGAVFDLGAPLFGQRPAGWTSSDAAGLPVYPGLATYEEAESGVIDHALRVTFEQTRDGYFPPATHAASGSCAPDDPSMGLRLRLGAGFDISSFTGHAQVIATAMKRYGLIVADNGSNWFVSGSTDRRWNDDNLNQLKDIPGGAFEVVQPLRPEVTDC